MVKLEGVDIFGMITLRGFTIFDLHHFDFYRTNYYVYVRLQHIANPKSDEWTRFMHTLQDLKNQLADAEDEASSLSGLSSSPLR